MALSLFFMVSKPNTVYISCTLWGNWELLTELSLQFSPVRITKPTLAVMPDLDTVSGRET